MPAAPIPSIHSMSTAEWQAQFEKDGRVDLWLEEEFNAGSRLVVCPPFPPFFRRPVAPCLTRNGLECRA